MWLRLKIKQKVRNSKKDTYLFVVSGVVAVYLNFMKVVPHLFQNPIDQLVNCLLLQAASRSSAVQLLDPPLFLLNIVFHLGLAEDSLQSLLELFFARHFVGLLLASVREHGLRTFSIFFILTHSSLIVSIFWPRAAISYVLRWCFRLVEYHSLLLLNLARISLITFFFLYLSWQFVYFLFLLVLFLATTRLEGLAVLWGFRRLHQNCRIGRCSLVVLILVRMGNRVHEVDRTVHACVLPLQVDLLGHIINPWAQYPLVGGAHVTTEGVQLKLGVCSAEFIHLFVFEGFYALADGAQSLIWIIEIVLLLVHLFKIDALSDWRPHIIKNPGLRHRKSLQIQPSNLEIWYVRSWTITLSSEASLADFAVFTHPTLSELLAPFNDLIQLLVLVNL